MIHRNMRAHSFIDNNIPSRVEPHATTVTILQATFQAASGKSPSAAFCAATPASPTGPGAAAGISLIFACSSAGEPCPVEGTIDVSEFCFSKFSSSLSFTFDESSSQGTVRKRHKKRPTTIEVSVSSLCSQNQESTNHATSSKSTEIPHHQVSNRVDLAMIIHQKVLCWAELVSKFASSLHVIERRYSRYLQNLARKSRSHDPTSAALSPFNFRLISTTNPFGYRKTYPIAL